VRLDTNLTIRISQRDYGRLHTLASERGMSIGVLVRQAIEAALEEADRLAGHVDVRLPREAAADLVRRFDRVAEPAT